MAISEYKRKRDFRRTPEPRGASRSGKGRAGKPVFVIQQHSARSEHFDFRLQVDGTLKSWALPKGPSTDPREKRLAMRTEDHPLEYADFEGMIPEGEYGAGSVIVWDRGTYENLTEDEEDGELPIGEALEEGHLKVRLEGEKLGGAYALTRMGSGRKERWLLVKQRDSEADARRNPAATEPQSVLSGRTVGELKAESKKGD